MVELGFNLYLSDPDPFSLKNLAAYFIINFESMTYPGGKTIIPQLAFEVDKA